MKNGNESFDENEWTSDECAQLESLSEERIPPAGLKARTIQALRARALVGYSPVETPRAITPRLGFALAAAASAVFAAGAALGYTVAVRRVTPPAAGAAASNETRAVARAESANASSRPVRQVVWF